MLSRTIQAARLLARVKFPVASISLTQMSTQSTMPRWLEELHLDKKIYFKSMDEVEKSFMTGVKAGDGKFVFNFDKSLNPKYKQMEVSFNALRESCRCPECYFPHSQQRLYVLYQHHLQQKPETYHFDQENQLLHIKWAGSGHESVYSGPCVYANFSPHALYNPQPKRVWNRQEYMNEFQAIDFNKVISSESGMLEFLESIDKYGLTVLKDAPHKIGGQKMLSDALSYQKTTHFGETFTVENKVGASDLAYSAGTLMQHTDLVYYGYQPGLQLLHCIRTSGTGGESTFSDGFAVAEWLRKNEPETFEMMATNSIRVLDCTVDWHAAFLMQSRPAIGVRKDGSLEYISFNNTSCDTMREMSPKEQDKMLKAMKIFYTAMQSPEFLVEFRMTEGDIVVFDNRRVTHGRKAFEATEPRLLEGTYYDWDEYHSKMRVFKARQFRRQLDEYSKKYLPSEGLQGQAVQ